MNGDTARHYKPAHLYPSLFHDAREQLTVVPSLVTVIGAEAKYSASLSLEDAVIFREALTTTLSLYTGATSIRSKIDIDDELPAGFRVTRDVDVFLGKRERGNTREEEKPNNSN